MASPSAEWMGTYNAALQGLSAGVIGWASRGHVPVNDAEIDAMLARIEAAATRSANRVHGVERDAPADDEPWPGL